MIGLERFHLCCFCFCCCVSSAVLGKPKQLGLKQEINLNSTVNKQYGGKQFVMSFLIALDSLMGCGGGKRSDSREMDGTMCAS